MKNFNIIIAGVGGQGVITLLQVIDEAAFVEGYDVRSSELHGLSQRGGSVEAHIRFGKKACPVVSRHSGTTTGVYSPMVSDGSADLIISLEALEGLRKSTIAGKQTKLLINEYFLPFIGSPAKEDIIKQLKRPRGYPKKDFYLVPASQTCKDKLQKEVVSTMYILGYAVSKKLMPLKKESVLQAIKNVIPEKYQELNIKAFLLANEHEYGDK